MARGRSALLVTSLVLCACAHRPVPSATEPEPATLELELPRFPSGEPYALSSDRGHVVLLDVWATWCEPCKDSLPAYEALAREYRERGLRVYAINVDSDRSQLQQFLQTLNLTLPVLYDEDARVAERTLRVSMMPTSFLIDRRGVLRRTHEGLADGFVEEYRREIEALLAER